MNDKQRVLYQESFLMESMYVTPDLSGVGKEILGAASQPLGAKIEILGVAAQPLA